jgi:hypothetical protein
MTAMTMIVGTALAVLASVTVVRIVFRARGLRRRLRARYFATAARFYATRRAVGRRLAGIGARIESRRARRVAALAAAASAPPALPADRARRSERTLTT